MHFVTNYITIFSISRIYPILFPFKSNTKYLDSYFHFTVFLPLIFFAFIDSIIWWFLFFVMKINITLINFLSSSFLLFLSCLSIFVSISKNSAVILFSKPSSIALNISIHISYAGIFQGREGFLEKGTSINILPITHERKAPQEKFWIFFPRYP